MKLVDILPPCPRADCPEAPGAPPGHKHLLPNQAALLAATEDLVLSAGGYGSGKSVAAAVKGYLLTAGVPGNRGLVLRETLTKLHDTAWRMFLEVCTRIGVRYEARRKRDGIPHHLIFENGSEVQAYEWSDPDKFLGPEYGWAWPDEAIGLPELVFQKLIGRVRLPQAAGQRVILLTTNPPPPNHWLTRMFGADPGTRTLRDPVTDETLTLRRIGSASTENPVLDRKYLALLRATLPAAEVQRVLEGRTAFVSDGTPVYCPPFRVDRHVAEVTPGRDPDGRLRPITRGWDFGFRAPAVLWSQIWRCDRGQGHWSVLDEYLGDHIETEPLAQVVLARSAERYRDCPVWVDVGDDAGRQRHANGPGPIHRLADPPYRLRIRSKRLPSLDPGLALIRKVLSQSCDCQGRKTPLFQVDRRCVVLIDALAGGYHYPPPKAGRALSEKPVKDDYYDHPADALRYTAEVVYRAGAMDPAAIARLHSYLPPARQWRSPIGVAAPPLALVRDPWSASA